MISILLKYSKSLLLLGLTIVTLEANAQVQLCLGQDATVCPGQSVTITNCNATTNPVAGLFLNAK